MDLTDLLSALLVPEEIVSAQCVRVPGKEALCMTLRRLSYPNRLCELELLFNRHSSVISSVVSTVLAHMEYYFNHLLADLKTHRWLNLIALENFSEVSCIRSTMSTINVSDLCNCIEMCSTLRILQATDLYHNLEMLTAGRKYAIYGDPAYPLLPLLIKPFGGTALQPHEAYFNKSMSRVRQAVEWGFGKVASEFAFVDFHKNQKISRQRKSDVIIVLPGRLEEPLFLKVQATSVKFKFPS
ncbi:hypothetical protein MTO96_051317 [Rhipicephalus appendiculatus]